MLRKVLDILIYLFAAIGFLLVAGYFAVRMGITNTEGIIDLQQESFLQQAGVGSADTPLWAGTEEWRILESAIRKDTDAIDRASADSGIPARLIVANLVTEQLRLFFTEREAYKQFFYPLKILGAQTQFSWGVMGMKEETAIQVEQHLKNPASPYYPGPQYERLLDFPEGTEDVKTARFTRMTDQHDHYWSYLYAALFIKEIEAQWRNAGFPIEDRPEISSTLFNIGFAHSVPKADPQVGGAEIEIGGRIYSFGGLAADFYNSDLLTDIFPR